MCLLLWYFICRLVTFHPYHKDSWYHLLTILKKMWKYDYTTFGIHSHSHWHLWQIQIIKGLQLVSFSNQRFHLRGNTYLIWCEWCKVLQCWEDSEAQTECLSTRKPNLKTAHYSFNFYDFFLQLCPLPRNAWNSSI